MKDSTLAEAVDDFIACVAKEIPTLLPTPARATRSDQQVTILASAPRCSLRVAKLPPKFDLYGQPLIASSSTTHRAHLTISIAGKGLGG